MTLYVTDAEMIRRLGVGEKIGRRLLPLLTKRAGFPQKDPAFGDRRFWPAVLQWLHDRHGVRAEFRERHDEAAGFGRAGVGLRSPEGALGSLLEATPGHREERVSVYDAARMATERFGKPNGTKS